MKSAEKKTFNAPATAEDVIEQRDYIRNSGEYFVSVCGITLSLANITQAIAYLLSVCEKDDAILDVYCEQKTKIDLLQKFWQEEFNYLGTRVRIKTISAITPNITGMLFHIDGYPVGWLENQNP